MLALTDPHEAYRVSEFDARLNGARAADLVTFCLVQVIQGIGSALFAHELCRPAVRSKALTRALTALTALEMGVDHEAPPAQALLQIYGSARRALLDCALDFRPQVLATIRADFREILEAVSDQP